MLNHKSTLALALVLVSGSAMANVAVTKDVQAGLSVQEIIFNAEAKGLSTLTTINQIAELHLDNVASAVELLIEKTPEQADDIVSAALMVAPSQLDAILVTALKAAPNQSEAIITAAYKAKPTQSSVITNIAYKAGVSNEIIVTASIAAGKDPAKVGQATAAGKK